MKKLFHICLLAVILDFACYFSVLAQWTTGTLFPARSGMTSANVGNKALFAGGYYTDYNYFSSLSTQVDIYDGVTNQSTTAQLSQARELITAISVDNLVFFAGGNNGMYSLYGSLAYNNVDLFNASTGQWTTAQLSLKRYNIAVASAAGKVFFGAGRSDFRDLNTVYTNVLDIYDIATNQWLATRIPDLTGELRALSVNNKILFFGGPTTNSEIYSVRIYEVANSQWTTANLSSQRSGVAVTSVGNKAFFAGGINNSNVVDIYDGVTNQWTTAQLSQGRTAITAISVNNKVLFAGGNNNSNVVDIYDETTNQWSIAQLSQGRSGIAATVVGNKVFFAGSSTGSSVVDIYDAVTNQWSTTQLPRARLSLLATRAGERALFAENARLGIMPPSGAVDAYTTNPALPALPVNLVSFTGKWTENIGAQLTWQTSLETNNDHFQIQRSSDARSFETIGRIQGKGSTNERTAYSFTDADMPDQLTYYRLKQVDLDGSVHFSNIIAINRQENKQAARLTVWPSPATGLLTLELSGGSTISQINIYDLHGRRLYSQAGTQTSTDVSGLHTGAYVVDVLTTDGQHLRSRFIKQ